ncbi:MAG: cation-transporting P-type ATPase [Christensenellales bacterium]
MNLQGLNKQQVEESRQKHGANTLTQIPPGTAVEENP